MPLVLDENQAAYQIHAYKPGHIQVNDMTLTQSLIISATQLITDWPPQVLAELTETHLQAVLPLAPTILLIGTGARLQFPAMAIYGNLLNHGIGVEVMDTSAACRTFNALSAEGRNVVAALLLT
jgi:uncharacterized protein